jgi:hypothetical protein
MKVTPSILPQDNLPSARPMGLIHEARSDAALRLADDVATRCEPHLNRKRTLGKAGRVTLRQDLGVILADLLRAAFKNRPCSAARGHAGAMWRTSPLRYDAFWQRFDALAGAGLVGSRRGVRLATDWGDGQRLAFSGIPAAMWPTVSLMDLAEAHGVTAGTVRGDWAVSHAAELRTYTPSTADLVRCNALAAPSPRIGRSIVKAAPGSSRPERTPAAILPPDQEAELPGLRASVAALNAHVAAASIRGCLAPSFRRSFTHSLRLGGRLYAVGADSYQGMTEAERAAITLNGEGAVEVDVRSSQLSIFLAITGAQRLPAGDLYDCPGVAREVAKEWCVQNLGAGRHLRSWGRNTPAAIKLVSFSTVRAAMIAKYPALTNPQAAVPRAILADLPEDKRGWGAGQYLVWRESEIIWAALMNLKARGVVALPVHDSIIVPKSAEAMTREALTAASTAALGFPLRLH